MVGSVINLHKKVQLFLASSCRILNNIFEVFLLMSERIFIICSISVVIIILSSCKKSESAAVKSLQVFRVQQKLCMDEMLVLSNKTMGVTFVDLTRIEKMSVDYRWRLWAPNQAKEQTGKGSSTISRIKLGKDNTLYMGGGCLLKIGDARVRWDIGGDDYIWVFYQLGVTTVCILPDTNFDTLTPSAGLARCEEVKASLIPERNSRVK
jgi:hypothetical protein